MQFLAGSTRCEGLEAEMAISAGLPVALSTMIVGLPFPSGKHAMAASFFIASQDVRLSQSWSRQEWTSTICFPLDPLPTKTGLPRFASPGPRAMQFVRSNSQRRKRVCYSRKLRAALPLARAIASARRTWPELLRP